MRQEEINRLSAFEMWMCRRLAKVSWTDEGTNKQVLSSINEKRSLIKTIWDRKKNWIGHVVRGRWSDEIGAIRENGWKETK